MAPTPAAVTKVVSAPAEVAQEKSSPKKTTSKDRLTKAEAASPVRQLVQTAQPVHPATKLAVAPKLTAVAQTSVPAPVTATSNPFASTKSASLAIPSAQSSVPARRKHKTAKHLENGSETNPIAQSTGGSAKREDRITKLIENGSETKPIVQSTGDWAKAGAITILKLAFVLALAYLTILALKWLSDRRESAPHGSKDMQIVDTIKLATGSSVHLVNVRGKSFLIGSTAGQVNLLSEVDAEEIPAAEPETDKKFTDYLEKYYTGPKAAAGPATRIAGMLRDATAHIKERRTCVINPCKAGTGGKDES